MQQHLVLWGDIGTDRKALLAIHLNEAQSKVWIHAFPKERVDQVLQDQLFAWRNGGEFQFPEDIPVWEVDANGDSLLPREIRVDKPELINRAQSDWGKLIMSTRLFNVCKEELQLFKQLVTSGTEKVDEQWNRAQELAQKYADMKKERDLTWEQAGVLKTELDTVFDMLKAKKRLTSEKDKEQHKKLTQDLEKQIEAQRTALIYPEEWNNIFDQLRKIQDKVKDAPLGWGHKRTLFDQINSVFDSLKQYRKSQNETHLKDRIGKLTKILKGIEENMQKDKESLQAQKDKLSHYIRGNKSSGDWGGLLKITEDRIKEKEEKAADIRKTLADLKKKLEKEQQRQQKESKSAEEVAAPAEHSSEEGDA